MGPPASAEAFLHSATIFNELLIAISLAIAAVPAPLAQLEALTITVRVSVRVMANADPVRTLIYLVIINICIGSTVGLEGVLSEVQSRYF